MNDFQDGVNIRNQRLEPEVLLTGDTIHPARTAMPPCVRNVTRAKSR